MRPHLRRDPQDTQPSSTLVCAMKGDQLTFGVFICFLVCVGYLMGYILYKVSILMKDEEKMTTTSER